LNCCVAIAKTKTEKKPKLQREDNKSNNNNNNNNNNKQQQQQQQQQISENVREMNKDISDIEMAKR
jgi:hypothetical protein